MKALDLGALAVLACAVFRVSHLALRHRSVTWARLRRVPTSVTAAFATAAVVGGVLTVSEAIAIVVAVEVLVWCWTLLQSLLLPGADATAACAAVTLIGLHVVLHVRLGAEVTTALAPVAVGAVAAVVAAAVCQRLDVLSDRGALLLSVGIGLYAIAALVSGQRLAVIPVPGGAVQVGDAARLLVLVGTALVLAAEPLRYSNVHGRSVQGAPKLPVLRSLQAVLFAWFVALALAVATRDFGGAALLVLEIAVLASAILGRTWPIAATLPALAFATVAGARVTGHVAERIDTWLAPERLPAGHQHVLAMSAWTDGGWSGRGLGGGQPLQVPAVSSDYVLALVGEELGVVGALGITMLVTLIVVSAVRTAFASSGQPGAVALAAGVFVGLQAVAVVLGSTGALPLTGIPFPFISRGGSALVANCVAVGLIVALSARPEVTGHVRSRSHGSRGAPAWRVGGRR